MGIFSLIKYLPLSIIGKLFCMFIPVQDTLSAAMAYKYEMDAVVVRMEELQTANNILIWCIVLLVCSAISICFMIIRYSNNRLKSEKLANKLLSKQAAAMPFFIERVNAISNKSIKLSATIYDEFQEAIDAVKREHKNGIVEILQDDEFYKLYPYLKELSVLSVQEKFVLILTEDGYTSSQIGLLLGSSANTVKTVRSRVRGKLRQHKNAGAYMRMKIFKSTK